MREESRLGTSVMAIALLVALGAYAVDVNVNFATGEGTNGWAISANSYASPEYTRAVDQISLSYAGQGASGSAIVYAADAQGGEDRQVATISYASSSATFAFPDTTSFRVFRIETTGDMALQSFFAKVSEATLESPSGVIFSNNITGTSFDAYWNAVEGATGYKVYVWTNAVVGASAGTEVWQESFTNSPAKTSTVNFKDEFTDSGTSGWTFEKAYASISNGAVRIGTTSDKGVLVSPELPTLAEAPLTLRITAWRQSTSDGTDMPVGVVSGGMTNIAGVICLGDLSKEYHVELPSLVVGDRIALFSPTNKSSARAILDDVAIVSGYSEGHEEPAYIVNGLDVGNVAEYSFSGLPSVPVSFAVEAYGRRGVSSSKAAAVVVDLANPDKVAVLNACPISSLASSAHTYTQNFDSLAAITAATGDKEWKNGTTLEYWQAWQDNDAFEKFVYNAGSATASGLYALAANKTDEVRAFGVRTKQGLTMTWGLAFTNDTGSTISLTNVSYSAQQWGFANTTNQLLLCACLVTNRLDWIVNFTEGWQTCAETEAQVFDAGTHAVPESVAVDYVPAEQIRIAPGEVLYLKWTFHPPTKGSSALMAIDDLMVGFDVKKQGLVLRLAQHQIREGSR